jgi:hypothetical protein
MKSILNRGRMIIGFILAPVAGSFKHGHEPSGTIKGGTYVDQPSDKYSVLPDRGTALSRPRSNCIVNYRPVLSSERALQNNKPATV